MREVVFYAVREAIRNAGRYGRGNNTTQRLHLTLRVRFEDSSIAIEVEDDGVGVAAGIARDGGSGEGLALHETMMAVSGGSLVVESGGGGGTRVRVRV